MEVHVLIVDAFTACKFGGNPAGVVMNEEGVDEVDLQKIARELHLSETAFVKQVDDNVYDIRFFTPSNEITFSGHASIATFYALAKKGYIIPLENGTKTIYQQTNNTKYEVNISYKDWEVFTIEMEMENPEIINEDVDVEDILKCFNIKKEEIGVEKSYYNPMIVSSGIRDLMIPIKSLDTLNSLSADVQDLKKMSKKYNVLGIHAFFIPEKNPKYSYVRKFAPRIGIVEESATGNANTSLLYYIKENGITANDAITCYQGQVLKRPSKIDVFSIETENGTKYFVKGTARFSLDGVIYL